MAESRRVQLTTLINANLAFIDPTQVLAPERVGTFARPEFPTSDKDTFTRHTQHCKSTSRYSLTLFEPDERHCPEFNYGELAKKPDSKKAEVIPTTFNGEEIRENDELEALAKLLEEKYGDGNKRKKDRIQDLVDMGDGYDDEDSFIDNSEAYDEFVPASLTTKYGGFYVNSGPLQFRQASDTDTDEDFTTHRNKLTSQKRKLGEEGEEKPKKKKKKNKENGQNNSLVDSNLTPLMEKEAVGVQIKKKKKKKKKQPAKPFSVTDMLRKFQRQKEKQKKVEEALETSRNATASIIHLPYIPLCPVDPGGGLGLADPLLSLIGSTNESALLQAASTMDFVIDLDTLLEATVEDPDVKNNPSATQRITQIELQQPTGELDFAPQIQSKCQPQSVPEAQSSSVSQPKTTVSPSTLSQSLSLLPSDPMTSSVPHHAPLPEGLPAALEKRIIDLTLAAKGSEGESKQKFFTPEINHILLDVELQCRELGIQVRSKVYTHLAFLLPCSRDTLLKRVKKLLQAQKDPMQKLKEAVSKAMPEQISRYHDYCQAHALARVAEEGKEKESRENAGSEEEEGEERSGKRVVGPRKKFKWNDEIRECLCSVVRIKMERYDLEQGDNQGMDEYLKTFLDNEVKHIWPKGWMQPGILLKESKKTFNPTSSLLIKKAKPEKKQPSLGGTNTASLQAALEGAGLKEPPLLGSGVFSSSQDPDNLLDESFVGTELAALTVREYSEGRRAEEDYSTTLPVEKAKAPISITISSIATDTSPLNSLAEETLARKDVVQDSVSQVLLAAAIASAAGDTSPHHRSPGLDLWSPPPPPPPPQSSPVGELDSGGPSPQTPILQCVGFPGPGDAPQELGKSYTALVKETAITAPEIFHHGLTHNGSYMFGEGPNIQRKL